MIIAPFLFQTLHDGEFAKLPLKEPSYIAATDGCKLAYYPFLSADKAVANMIFYHGSGAWSGTYYQYMAQKFAQKQIAVFLVDIRGHGNSQGPRGDAPSTQQVFADITTVVEYISAQFPRAPTFLGGHSSGAGLVLNYNSFYDNPFIDGYFVCAPYLGPYANVYKKHAQKELQFIKKIRIAPLIIHAVSKGWLCAHSVGIYFNYPAYIKQKEPYLLDFYTCAMTTAISLTNAQDAFKKIKKPLLLCVGTNDEQFIAQKIIDVASCSNTLYKPMIIDGANHFSILTDYTEAIVGYLKNYLKHMI